MTTQLAPTPVFKAFDNNGNPLASGQLFTYIAGTSTPQATWVDSTQTTQNTNPVILNARGEAGVWLDVSLFYKLVLQDSTGNAIWTVDQVPGGYLTVAGIAALLTPVYLGAILYPRSSAEIAANVTPTNIQYPYGDFRRYGADPTGVAASDAAIQQCLSCNSDCFDGQPGGGTYLLTQSLVLSKFGQTLRGQGRAIPGFGMAGGTTFNYQSTVVGSAAISTTAAVYGLAIRDICFTFVNNQFAQRAMLFGNDLRYSVIERNFFLGTINSTNTNFGIQFINSSQFTGDVVIKDNFFDGLINCITFGGPVTTVKVLNNEMYGYATGGTGSQGAITGFTLAGGSGYNSGTSHNILVTGGNGSGAIFSITSTAGVVTAVMLVDGGHGYKPGDVLTTSVIGAGSGFTITVTTTGAAGGIAIHCQRPTVEVRFTNNYAEGFTTVIYNDDAAYICQTGNDYAVCYNAWVWIKIVNARLWNTSVNETFVGGGGLPCYINYSQAPTDFAFVMSQPDTAVPGPFFANNGAPGWFVGNTPIAASAGYIEGTRTFANGHFQAIAYSGGNFGGQWAPSSGQVTLEQYTIAGNVGTLNLVVSGATITATGTTLTFTMPAGFRPSQVTNTPCWVTTGAGTKQFGLATTAANSATLTIYVDATQATNWPTGASGAVNLTWTGQVNGAFA